MPSEQPAEAIAQHIAAVMQQNLAHHQRRNELLMDLANHISKRGGWHVWFDGLRYSANDLRIIADELDRRNKQ